MCVLTDCHNKGCTPSLQGMKVSAGLLLLLNLKQGERGPQHVLGREDAQQVGPHAYSAGLPKPVLPYNAP